MRRALIATAGTAAALIALLSYKSSDAVTKSSHKVVVGPTTPGTAPSATPASPGTTSSATTTPSNSTTTQPANSSSGVKVLTGADVQYNYGDIQLRVTLVGRTIKRIDVVQDGAADSRSQFINSEALPILTREALAAQGFNIDVVSGATFTSQAFAQALQSAIDPSGS